MSNYSNLTDKELDNAIQSARKSRDAMLVKRSDIDEALSDTSAHLSELMSEKGKRNHKNLMKNFKLNADHVALLACSSDVATLDEMSDIDIAIALGMPFQDDFLLPEQEERIAKVMSEIRYAQSYVNQNARKLL